MCSVFCRSAVHCCLVCLEPNGRIHRFVLPFITPPVPNRKYHVIDCGPKASATTAVNIGKKQTGLKLPLPAMASGAARLRDFKVIKQLGKGAYGTVYKVERKGDDSAFYALKKVSSANLATR